LGMSRKKIFLLLTLVLPLFLLILVRSLTTPNYFLSSIYKVVFLAPFLYAFLFFRSSWKKQLLKDFSFLAFRRYFSVALLWGVIIGISYFMGFLLLKSFLSFDAITSSLAQFASITPTNILFIGAYIILFNSLLEEFFWRGFFFQESLRSFRKFWAYFLTGIGFSLYHLAFLYTWFSWPFIFLAGIGLFMYSFVMCFLFERYKDLFTCWFIHAIVDVAQITIALILFGII